MRILSSFWQVDIGPNLEAINRSVLIATDYVVIPLGADLFSLQSLKNLGPTLKSWQGLWKKRLDNWETCREKNSYPDFQLPQGKMQTIGYLCQQHGVILNKPLKAYDKWVNRIPNVYRKAVLNQTSSTDVKQADDPYCLATIKYFRSLIPMAREHRKPIFNLTSVDGAIGSHANAVQDAKKDFKELALKIAEKIGLEVEKNNYSVSGNRS